MSKDMCTYIHTIYVCMAVAIRFPCFCLTFSPFYPFFLGGGGVHKAAKAKRGDLLCRPLFFGKILLDR